MLNNTCNSSPYIITLIWNYNSVNMATLNKTMTLTMAIVFLTIVCASDIPSSSNTSFNISSNATSTHPCGILYYIIYGPLSCTVYAFGLIGNSLSFAVLHKYTSGNVGIYLLKAFAVTDNIFLATTLISARIDPVVPEKVLYVIVTLLNTSLSWTDWMIGLVAGNHNVAVCRPMMASRLCIINQVRLEILIMTAAVCVFNMPHLIDYCIMDNETILFENLTARHVKVARDGMFYYIIYANALHCIFVFLLPLSIIIFFNVHVMRSLKVAQRSRKVMTSLSRSDDNNITQCCRKAMTSRSSNDETNITQRSRMAMTSLSSNDETNITQCSRMAMTSLSSNDETNITQRSRMAMTSLSSNDETNITQRSRMAMTSLSSNDETNITQCSRMAMMSLSSNYENNISIVMIVIIIVFVACQAPMIMSIPIICFND